MPTFRSDVVGSLLRPDSLKEARAALEAGRMTPAAFKQAEDRAVDEAIALQENAGLSVVTDGELRRYAFFGHLVEALEGFDKFGGWAIPFHNEQGEQIVFKRPVVVEKLRWRHSMCAEEWVYLRARTKKAGKVTLISAQQAAAYYDPDKSKAAYPTRDAYLADVVDLTRREVEELIRLGCTYIQIDAPQYAALLDPEMREGYRKRGSDPDRMIDTTIEMDNADDDERSGTFEPLRVVPDDRVVVLGLVTSKKPRVETVAELTGRVQAAAKVVPLERLALSPQCGFASTIEGNRISRDEQKRKLEVVAATARAVWADPRA